MATQSSILACWIPWIGEPGRLQPWVPKESDTTEWLTLTIISVGVREGESKICFREAGKENEHTPAWVNLTLILTDPRKKNPSSPVEVTWGSNPGLLKPGCPFASLEILSRCRFWLSGPGFCISNQLPGDVSAAGPQSTLWGSRSNARVAQSWCQSRLVAGEPLTSAQGRSPQRTVFSPSLQPGTGAHLAGVQALWSERAAGSTDLESKSGSWEEGSRDGGLELALAQKMGPESS